MWLRSSKRLPLSGSRRIVWRNGREDAIRSLLNVLEALQKQLRISAVEADVVLCGGPGFKSNSRTHDIRNGLRLGLANTLRSF
jgi:hypothetical protein